MRLGVFGGTFDPIHLGHLIIAEEARSQMNLEKVLFIPTGHPYLRPAQPSASGRDRLAMVRLAIQDNPAFEASSVEIDRQGPTYSVDTLEALQKLYGAGTESFFIVGQDAFLEIPAWKSPDRLVSMCTIAVVRRPGMASLQRDGEWSLGSAKANVTVIDAPLIGISGTEIRRRVAHDISVRYWVPPAVENYMRTHTLYRAAASSRG
ncbi:MAG: nicotinate-nucleotide adenylyltransferase [Dehalococcoidia bacterium]|nr:nicotinate-nucleotide adenylyltransferase [Dehalococcoidia bacterium]